MNVSFRQLTCNFWTPCETHNGSENISTRVVLLVVGLRSAVNDLIARWRSGGLADENKGTLAKWDLVSVGSLENPAQARRALTAPNIGTKSLPKPFHFIITDRLMGHETFCSTIKTGKVTDDTLDSEQLTVFTGHSHVHFLFLLLTRRAVTKSSRSEGTIKSRQGASQWTWLWGKCLWQMLEAIFQSKS